MKVEIVRHHRRAEDADGDEQHGGVGDDFHPGGKSAEDGDEIWF